MSKSKGNVLDPNCLMDEFTSEGLRYFLLREGVPHSDGNFSRRKLVNYLNSELANTLGNLLCRCTARSLNPAQAGPSRAIQDSCSESERNLLLKLQALPSAVAACYDDFKFYSGIDQVMEALRETNAYIEREKPWVLKKDPASAEKLSVVLGVAMESLRVGGILLQPIVPRLASMLLDKLSISGRSWADAEVAFPDGGCNRSLSRESVVLFEKIKE